MAKRVIPRKPRQNRMSAQQELFVVKYFELHMNAKEAANAVGYKNPEVAGCRLLNPIEYPLVALAVEKERNRRLAVVQFKNDDILRLLQAGSFMNYLALFEPGEIKGGWWLIEEAKLHALPMDAQRCIRHAEWEVIYEPGPDGTVSAVKTGKVKVKMIDKEILIGMCAKHMLGDKINVTGDITQINWMLMREKPVEIVDSVEAKILAVTNSVPSALSANEVPSTPSQPSLLAISNKAED